ncbi:MAG: aminotransferase class V-fold PLP-dependent enzyme, partial [bacterium]
MASSPQTILPEGTRTTSGGLDPVVLRRDFPILGREIDGRQLVYLDNAATSQKPTAVLDAMDRYYREFNANVHRGIHLLSEEATRAYEGARTTLSRFIGAPDPATCIFTRNTTEAINLVARSWGPENIGRRDEILVTEMEHHSNIVPWQMLAERVGAKVRFLPITDDGRLDLSLLDEYLTERTRLAALVHVSNVLGTVNPVREIARRAHEAGAKVLVDGAQSAPHLPVNVQELDVDFFAFSGHKMCGPTGAGMLYGKKELLDAMPPFLGGGEMIDRVRK